MQSWCKLHRRYAPDRLPLLAISVVGICVTSGVAKDPYLTMNRSLSSIISLFSMHSASIASLNISERSLIADISAMNLVVIISSSERNVCLLRALASFVRYEHHAMFVWLRHTRNSSQAYVRKRSRRALIKLSSELSISLSTRPSGSSTTTLRYQKNFASGDGIYLLLVVVFSSCLQLHRHFDQPKQLRH